MRTTSSTMLKPRESKPREADRRPPSFPDVGISQSLSAGPQPVRRAPPLFDLGASVWQDRR
jgi:hypothetical protein